MRRMVLLLVLLFAAVQAPAANTRLFKTQISATSSNSTVNITDNVTGGDAAQFCANTILFINNSNSANEVYVLPGSATATAASDFEVQPGESRTFNAGAAATGCWNKVAVICATGETATVRVEAVGYR